MNELLGEKLISLLSDTSQEKANQEMQSAYESFKKQVKTVNQSERNYLEIYRILDTTRIELLFIESIYRYEQGKKCPRICLS